MTSTKKACKMQAFCILFEHIGSRVDDLIGRNLDFNYVLFVVCVVFCREEADSHLVTELFIRKLEAADNAVKFAVRSKLILLTYD